MRIPAAWHNWRFWVPLAALFAQLLIVSVFILGYMR
jgi:hypothetical protein